MEVRSLAGSEWSFGYDLASCEWRHTMDCVPTGDGWLAGRDSRPYWVSGMTHF